MIATDLTQVQPIGIIGDFIIDETKYVVVTKISPEAPIPVANLINYESFLTPGGAGLAAAYSKTKGLNTLFLSMLSPFSSKLLDEHKIPYRNISRIPYNVRKLRFIDTHSKYQLIRIDNDDLVMGDINKQSFNIEDLDLKQFKALALLDYRKGLLNKDNCQALIDYAKALNIPIFADTRGDICKYRGIDIIKLNEKEYKTAALKLGVNNPRELIKILDINYLLISKAADGAEIFGTEEYYHAIPKEYLGIPDVSGGGDVLDISFCYNLYVLGHSISMALQIAVDWATEYVYSPTVTRLICP